MDKITLTKLEPQKVLFVVQQLSNYYASLEDIIELSKKEMVYPIFIGRDMSDLMDFSEVKSNSIMMPLAHTVDIPDVALIQIADSMSSVIKRKSIIIRNREQFDMEVNNARL